MSSASEAELGELLVTAQEMVAMRNTLEEMKWPQPKSPIQTDNCAAAGVVNNNIVPWKLNTMDRRLHWIRCREAQGQFRYYRESGSLNWGGGTILNITPPPLSRIENNAIFGKYRQHHRHLVTVMFQQGCIFPGSR